MRVGPGRGNSNRQREDFQNKCAFHVCIEQLFVPLFLHGPFSILLGSCPAALWAKS